MRRTYYIRDRARGDRIVNAVSAESIEGATRALVHMVRSDDLWLDSNPPRAVLTAYRYWSERP